VSTALSSAPVERIRRVDLFAYVLALLGVSFVTEFAAGGGGSAAAVTSVGAAIVGVCAIVGALHVRRHPENVRRGTESAPVFLYLLAGVATVAFLVVTVVRFGLV
jgi:drug/metabolite transporter (DMT)-like permease